MSIAGDMMRAGALFGFLSAIREHADSVIARSRKAAEKEEATLPNGVDKLRHTWRRKPALFVLR